MQADSRVPRSEAESRRTADPPPFGLAPGRRRLAVGLVALAAFAVFLGLFRSYPVLLDADSYFHLAVARSYAEEGLRRGLEWARFSVLHEGFGDKELLFHLLLVPFATLGDPLLGGRLALALLNAGLVAVLAAAGARALGALGLLVPVWLYLTATTFFFRLDRLRPEALALILLLLAAQAAAARRYRWLGILTLLFTWSYTAFHALLGLCLLWMLVEAWRGRRFEPRLLLYPLLGASLGLVLHPQFPANLTVWAAQNLAFFRLRHLLDVGGEFAAPLASGVVVQHLGWWLGLAILWRGCEVRRRARRADEAVVMAVATACFGVLYLQMARFATFFYPFATLAFLALLESRGRAPGRWLRLPWRGRLPLVPCFLVAIAVGLPPTTSILGRKLEDAAGPLGWDQDRRAFAAHVPAGARVAATWGAAEWYAYFAPRGRYLNVLDPVFMAVSHPRIYELQRSLFENREPDPALVVGTALDSDYLAVHRTETTEPLAERVLADPRWRVLYAGYHLLAELEPGANADFVLDWAEAAPGTPLPLAADRPVRLRPYPRLAAGAGFDLEGYVDGRRTGRSSGCRAWLHSREQAAATAIRWELAPSGPTRMWIDEELVAAVGGDLDAALGSGLTIERELPPGAHSITIESCASRSEPPRLGFYLLEREQPQLPR